MPLSPGQQVGSYEIVSLLGAGGMGEVYRARDARLKRDVAIKVLPDDVAGDHERLARFQREAEVLASLNHPHIAHVYGIEAPSAGSGQAALVMELVEGEDLAQRIARGAIPIDEALPIARQIAEALEAAHDAGIIHRDLKPANVKVRPDGTVKVLDFGLAKAIEQGSGTEAQGSGSAANSPTITTPAMTMRGVILGTAAYMSPEQAKGKLVDRRADIWAFGCVLYEMLTGRRTFEGEDISDTLVSILRDDPRWAALPANTPPHIRQLLRRCLERDPLKRLPHIGAARLDLADEDPREVVKGVPPVRSWWMAAAIGSAIAGAAVTAVFLLRRGPSVSDSPVAEFSIEAPAGSVFAGGNLVPRFAVSRDGRQVVYQVDDGDTAKLLVRPIDSVDSVAIPAAGIERSGNQMQQAFWSPDGRFLGYFDEADHQLKRIDRQSGAVQRVADVAANQYGGSWNADDVIIMASAATGGIQRVAAGGGPVEQVTRIDRTNQEVMHLWPQFFPDGRHFIYLTTYSGSPSALFLGSLDGGTPRRLVASPSSAAPTNGDYIFYVREGSTVAQRVDVNQATMVGDPIVIGDAAARTPQGRAAISVSRTGVLAYAHGIEAQERYETRWVDRSGGALDQAAPPVASRFRALRLSPDNSVLTYVGRSPVGESVWAVRLQDLSRGIDTKAGDFAVGPGLSFVFSPDSTELITRSFATPSFTLLRQRLFSSAPPQAVLKGESAESVTPYDWIANPQRLIVSRSSESGGGVFAIPIDPREKPERYMSTRVRYGADLSPDGRWFAYASGTEQGSSQVFIQAFPDPSGGNWPVSALGGTHPRWSSDGRELFFLDQNQLNVVSVSTSPRLTIGQPRILFTITGSAQGVEAAGTFYPYDMMNDGKRFVYFEIKRAAAETKIVVITDWMRRYGVKR